MYDQLWGKNIFMLEPSDPDQYSATVVHWSFGNDVNSGFVAQSLQFCEVRRGSVHTSDGISLLF